MKTVRTSDALRLRMHYAPANDGLGEAGSRTALCGEVTYDEGRYQQIIGRKLRDHERFDMLPVCAACGAVADANRRAVA